MNETIQVTLDSQLVEELKQLTAQQGVSVETVFADAARDYVRDARREKIRQETEAYHAMHGTLKEKYFGQHVAIHNGQLVDHDNDASALLRRVRQRFGRIPIMFAQVGEQPVREVLIHSTRLMDPQ